MIYKKQIEQYYPTCEQERMDKKSIYHYMSQYPHNILTRSNKIAHLTSSGFIMNASLTKVLVIFHKLYQAWGWTGGHADGDHDLLGIAIREAKEETGLTELRPLSTHMMSMDILPVWGHFRRNKYVPAHLHLNAAYVLIADEEAPLIKNEEETEGIMWVEADRLAQYSTEEALVLIYQKLIQAARAYSPEKDHQVVNGSVSNRDEGFTKAIKDKAIPIAIHEAKSAYYKAMLVKEVTIRGSKGVTSAFKKLVKKINDASLLFFSRKV